MTENTNEQNIANAQPEEPEVEVIDQTVIESADQPAAEAVEVITNQGSADQQEQQGTYTYTTDDMTGQPPAHGKAVASLVLGIVGLCCCGICGIIGLVLSIQAQNAGNQEGIRKAGFILGIISIVLWILGTIFYLIGSFATLDM